MPAQKLTDNKKNYWHGSSGSMFSALRADTDEMVCSVVQMCNIGFLIVSSQLVMEHFVVFPFTIMIFALLLDFRNEDSHSSLEQLYCGIQRHIKIACFLS